MRRALLVLAVAAGAIAAYAGITHAAGSKRSAVSSEHVSLAVTASGAQLARPVTVRVDGAVDNVRRVGSFSIDLADAAAATPFVLPLTRVDAVVDASHGGPVAYVRVPQLARFFTQGKPWVGVDVGRLTSARLAPFTRLAAAPSQLLPTLRSMSSSERTLGAETTDGVPTTHAQLVLDVRRLAELAPATHRALAAAALDELVRESARSSVPVDVWTDADGLLRRAAATVEGQDGSRASFDLRLSDLGGKVDVEVPAARDTVDATGLLSHP